MLKSLHHAGVKLKMMLPYKIVNNNKKVISLVSVQYYFHTSLLWPVYYDNCRCYFKNNKKIVHLISSLAEFSLIVSFCVISLKICGSSRNFFFYVYVKLKLGTAKHICLK